MSILEDGDMVRDTYEVERLLGEGAFAEVYRVRHRFMGRQAMKVFKIAQATLPEIEQSLAEAILLSCMRHPNIVEVFDANILTTVRGQYGYFTMTHVAGGTLDRYWRSFGSDFIPVKQVVEIMKQVSRGLAVAHSATPPIVHRDIKPQNILVGYGPDGLQIRLSDFGLAKAVNPLTLLVSAKGTLGYKPPEALNNMDSPAADIWAMGSTLYLLLTDQMPFPALDDRDTADANRFLRPLRPPSIYNIAVDSGLESIIYRCLAADPSDRYPDAISLLRDLERWSPGEKADDHSMSTSKPVKPNTAGNSTRMLQQDAERLAIDALKVARDPAKLMLAADMLEEAISKDPALRERHEGQLQLWRKGVMHVSTVTFPGQTANKSAHGRGELSENAAPDCKR